MRILYCFPLFCLALITNAQTFTNSPFGYTSTNTTDSKPLQGYYHWDSMMNTYIWVVGQPSSATSDNIFHWTGTASDQINSSGTFPILAQYQAFPGNGVFSRQESVSLTDSSIIQLFQSRVKINGSGIEFLNQGPEATTLGQNSFLINSIIPVQDPKATPAIGIGSLFQEQHDASTITFSRADFSTYATLSSGEPNGVTSLALFTTTSSQPQENRGGAIAIYQSAGNGFGMFTGDSIHALIGWSNPSGRILSLSAFEINTDAVFTDQNYFKTQSGFVAASGDVDLSKISLAPGTTGFFGSNTADMSSIEIRNFSNGNIGPAGVRFVAGGTLATMALYPDNPGVFKIRSGSFVLQSMSDQGILINAIRQGDVIPVIRFAVDDMIVGSFGPNGFTTINMSDENMRAIPNPQPGSQVFNTTKKTLCFYNGRRWKAVKTDDNDK